LPFYPGCVAGIWCSDVMTVRSLLFWWQPDSDKWLAHWHITQAVYIGIACVM